MSRSPSRRRAPPQMTRSPGARSGRHQGVDLDASSKTVSSSGRPAITYFGSPTPISPLAADHRRCLTTPRVRAEDVVAHLVGLPMVAGGLPTRRLPASRGHLAWLGGFPTERILRSLPRLQVSVLMPLRHSHLPGRPLPPRPSASAPRSWASASSSAAGSRAWPTGDPRQDRAGFGVDHLREVWVSATSSPACGRVRGRHGDAFLRPAVGGPQN